MIQNNKFALMALRKVLSTNYTDEISKDVLSGRLQLDFRRNSAARYFAENYSREMRYLLIFERDFSAFLSSKDYLLQKDLEHQYYFDFLVSFDSLNEKIKEFGWTVEFLGANGIDYLAICKLYNAVA